MDTAQESWLTRVTVLEPDPEPVELLVSDDAHADSVDSATRPSPVAAATNVLYCT